MKRLLAVLLLLAVYFLGIPVQASALPVVNRTNNACDSIVVTDENSYVENFEAELDCWDLSGGVSEWDVSPFGYIYHMYGTYHCQAVSPVVDIRAVSNPYVSFYQKRPDFMGSTVADQLSVYYRDMSPEADTTWVLLMTYTEVAESWQHDSLPLPGGMEFVQLMFVAEGMGSDANGCSLDNVRIFNVPVLECYPVQQLQVLAVTETSVSLAWFGISEAGYIARYRKSSENVWTYTDTLYNMTVQINHLLPLQEYVVEVSALCDSLRYTALTFMTAMHAVSLPYSTNFSSVAPGEWLLRNGSCQNGWVIGQPANISTRSALFISHDGEHAQYDVSAFSIVTAQKNFTTGNSESIKVSFDVIVGGEGYLDFMKVFVAPMGIDYAPSNTMVDYAGFAHSEYALDFSDYMSQTGFPSYPYKLNLTGVNQLHVELYVDNPAPNGEIQLVFLWKNDNLYGVQPGANIFNLRVEERTCPTPSNLTAAATSNSALITWNAVAEAVNYTLQYKLSSESWNSFDVTNLTVQDTFYQLPLSLTPNTNYDVRVATDCGVGSSNWATTTFSTNCGVVMVTNHNRFEETFSANPICWELNGWPYDAYQGHLHHPYSSESYNAITPILNISAVTTPYVKFSQKRPDYQGSLMADQLSVYYKSEHSLTDTAWHLIRTYNNYLTTWVTDSLPLPLGLIDVRLKFAVQGAGYDADGSFLDNVIVYNGDADACVHVEDLAADYVGIDSVHISWTAFSSSGYEVRYKMEYDTVWTQWGSTLATEVWITNLLPAHQYTVEVAPACDALPFIPVTFTMGMAVANLPFFTDFSDTRVGDWQLSNGTCRNRWVIGSPAQTPGEYALFISSDNENAIYDPTAYSIVSASKLFTAGTEESYQISFDVLAGGETHFDYLKVFLAPADVEYPASTVGTTYAASNYSVNAADFIDYLDYTSFDDFRYKLNLTNNNTLHVTLEMPNPAPGGLMKLVFLWRNDQQNGIQPGAIISNVSLSEPTCRKPNNLTVSNVGSQSATVNWTGDGHNDTYIVQYKPLSMNWEDSAVVTVSVIGLSYSISYGLMNNTDYEVRVATACGAETSTWRATSFRTQCGVEIVTDHHPYEENFADYPSCWDISGGSSPWQYSEQSQYLYHNYGNYTCDAISPILDISAVTHPYFQCSHRHQDYNGSGITDSIKIYYRNTLTGPWVLIHSCGGPVAAWDLDTVALPNPSSTYQIKITAVGMGSAANGCAINDIIVYNMYQVPYAVTLEPLNITQTSASLRGSVNNPDNMLVLSKGFEWKVTEGGTYTVVDLPNVQMNYSLSGLTSNTSYTYRAYATSLFGTSYGEERTFFTLPDVACGTPTGLQATVVTSESITIIWDESDDASRWNIQYRPEHGNFTYATSTTNSYVIQDILPNVPYVILVQANCGDNVYSEWSDSIIVTPTGVNNYLGNSITVYPNPTKEVVNVHFATSNDSYDGAMIEVFDVYGKIVRPVETLRATSLQTTQINVSGLADGMYFVRVTTDKGVVTKSFLKQ